MSERLWLVNREVAIAGVVYLGSVCAAEVLQQEPRRRLFGCKDDWVNRSTENGRVFNVSFCSVRSARGSCRGMFNEFSFV